MTADSGNITRTLSTSEVAKIFGVGARTVQLWTRLAPTPCPHTREKRLGKGRGELWFDRGEVLAWMSAAGLDTTRMSLFRDDAAEAEKAGEKGVWAETYRPSLPKRKRVSDEELEKITPEDLIREATREVLSLIDSMRDATTDSAPNAVQQMLKAITELSKEDRLLKDRKLAEDERRGRTIDIGRVARVLDAAGTYIRQTLGFAAVEIPAQAVSGVGVDPAIQDAIRRGVAAKLRDEFDRLLAAMVGQLQQAASELRRDAAGAGGEEKRAA